MNCPVKRVTETWLSLFAIPVDEYLIVSSSERFFGTLSKLPLTNRNLFLLLKQNFRDVINELHLFFQNISNEKLGKKTKKAKRAGNEKKKREKKKKSKNLIKMGWEDIANDRDLLKYSLYYIA